MHPVTCFIVDDNEMDRLTIEDHLSLHPDFKMKGSFSNPLECMESLKTQAIDVFFLDIDMPVINGINFLRKLEQPPICVFITSYPDFAVDAFEIEAIDYLLKPVKQDRFERAVNRIKTLMSLNREAAKNEVEIKGGKITIKDGNAIHIVMVSDIVYLEALANWTRIVTNNKKYVTLYNLKNFLLQLPEDKFLRVHRSYAVAKNEITKFQNNELQLGEHNIPVGKTYRKNIVDYLSRKQ